MKVKLFGAIQQLLAAILLLACFHSGNLGFGALLLVPYVSGLALCFTYQRVPPQKWFLPLVIISNGLLAFLGFALAVAAPFVSSIGATTKGPFIMFLVACFTAPAVINIVLARRLRHAVVRA